MEYTIDELREMVVQPPYRPIHMYQDRAIHEVTDPQRIPGEVFRIGVMELVDIFNDRRRYVEIEGSNFGRVKFRDKVLPQYVDGETPERNGMLYVRIPLASVDFCAHVHCVIAGLWCERDETRASRIHHISNNGFDNKPSNLIWLDARMAAIC